MHNESSSNLEYFVQSNGATGAPGVSTTVTVTKETDYFTNTPTFSPTPITVNAYNDSPGVAGLTDQIDDRMLSVDWVDNGTTQHMVSSGNVGENGINVARWYEFNAPISGTPTLIQQGDINPGGGTATSYPSIAINPSDSIAMTFLENGGGQPESTFNPQATSMYVTGRQANDPMGTMENEVLVKAGVLPATSPIRGGDYSATEYDPSDPNNFWSANEYQFDNSGDNFDWGNEITEFTFASGPGVTAAGNQTAAEGGSKTFTIGSFQDAGSGPDSGSINWGDGTTPTSLGTVTPGTLSNQTHTYAEEGSYTVTITITDAGSSQSGMGMFVVTVSDPNVAATGGLSFTAQEGALSTTQSVATFTDPGIAEANDGTHYSASINWGDNSTATTGTISFANGVFAVSGNHSYAEEGTYTVTVTINHENSTAQTVTSTATVADQAVAANGVGVNATPNASFTAPVATFTDPGTPEVLGDYSATINWGDNTPATMGTIAINNGTFTVSGTHSYGSTGSFTITTTIHHDTASPTTVMSTAMVGNVAVPVVTPAGNQTAAEGGSKTFTIGSFQDAGSGPDSGSINWGDGTTPTSLGTVTPGTLSNQTHTYAEEGSYTVTITITDAGSSQSGMGMFVVTVSDPNVAATGGLSFTAQEGALSTTQSVATFTDPGIAEANDSTHYSASINWGDNSTATTGTISFANGVFAVSGNHSYAEEGTYTVTVTINHENSTAQTVTSTATVADQAVAANGVGVNATPNASFTAPVATFTDPGTPEVLGDYSATINWGDNTPATMGTIAINNGTFTVSGSHAYASTGSFTVTTTIHHDTASPTTVMSTAMIASATIPIVTAAGNQTAAEGGSKTFTIGSFQDAGSGPDSGSINRSE